MAYNPRSDTRRVQAQLRAAQKTAVQGVAELYAATQQRLNRNWAATRKDIATRQQAGQKTGWAEMRVTVPTNTMLNTYANDLLQNIPATRAAVQAATQQAQLAGEQHARSVLTKLGENPAALWSTADHTPDLVELTRLQTVRAVTAVDRLTGKLAHYLDTDLLDSPVLARAFGEACRDPFAGAYTALRTEQMATFRAATSDMFDRSQSVDRWRWVARLDDRTCAFCWAMHGEIFEANEILNSHSNCACVPEPVVEGAEFGPAGVHAFKELPDADQERILGPAAKLALDDRQFHLYQVVTKGPGTEAASLTDLLGAERAATYVQAAQRAAQ